MIFSFIFKHLLNKLQCICNITVSYIIVYIFFIIGFKFKDTHLNTFLCIAFFYTFMRIKNNLKKHKSLLYDNNLHQILFIQFFIHEHTYVCGCTKYVTITQFVILYNWKHIFILFNSQRHNSKYIQSRFKHDETIAVPDIFTLSNFT